MLYKGITTILLSLYKYKLKISKMVESRTITPKLVGGNWHVPLNVKCPKAKDFGGKCSDNKL